MKALVIAVAAMIAVVAASNYLVQFPINDWLTYGAFTYPVSFLVTELTNRFFGPRLARRVVYAGFAAAVLLSLWLAPAQIAVASGTAFLAAQLLDITIFNRLRQQAWFKAPLISSGLASIVDTSIFFTIAFWGMSPEFVMRLGMGDLVAKFSMAIFLLAPFRMVLWRFAPHQGAALAR